jgi:hypothetical protein
MHPHLKIEIWGTRRGEDLKLKYRPLIIGVVTLAVLDLMAIITMIVNPDLTARVIPVLALIQIVGFVVIPVSMVRAHRRSATGEAQGTSASSSKEWMIWLVCGFAMIYLVRAVLAIVYMSVHGWHRYQIFVPIAGIAITGYLLYLAFLIRRSIRKKSSGEAKTDLVQQ